VNTNFREHGFLIEPKNLNDINQKIKRDWKKRISCGGTFCATSTVEDADRVPSNVVKEDALKANPQPLIPVVQVSPSDDDQNEQEKTICEFFDEKLNDFLPVSKFPEQRQQLKKILLETPESIDQKIKSLSEAAYFWIKNVSKYPTCLMTQAMEHLFPMTDKKTRDEVMQERANFITLISIDMDDSQIENQSFGTRTLKFDNFFEFYLRYGSPLDEFSSLSEITAVPEDAFGDINEESPASFKNGFATHCNKNEVLNILMASNKEFSWAVTHSKQPNMFALFALRNDYGRKNVAKLYVSFNPCFDNKSERFTVKIDDITKRAATWKELTDVLCLKDENALYIKIPEASLEETRLKNDHLENDSFDNWGQNKIF
jgi:hypothetical protein